MSGFHFYILILIGFTTLLTIGISLRRYVHLTPMSGMIISMYLGMNVGLTAGVTFGAIYQGNLFLSTMLGIGFGILAGFLCGICFGFLASIEGLMSGLMGGMMGAMLGEMISLEQAHTFIKIFSLLMISTVFLLLILSTSSTATIKKKGWILKPVMTAGIIGSILVVGTSLNVEKADSKSPSPHHQHDSADEPKVSTRIVIESSGFVYSPNELMAKKNVPITLAFINSDDIEHDIEIKEVPFTLLNKPTHQHGANENVLHVHANPHTTSEVTFLINEIGTYEFYCTIPGHKEAGMVGKLNIH